jgi:hypothetical protein
MAGGRQRHPQARHTERAQTAHGERQADPARLTGQAFDPVHRVLADHGEHRVIRRNKSGQKGVSPSGQAS